MEHERVQREAGEAEPETVEHRDERQHLDLDARLLEHLLDRHLGRRVPDVGPADGVEPDAGVGALGEEDLARVVAHHGRDRDLRGDVARDALADRGEPLLEERVGFGLFERAGADVGRDLENLLEALALVQALREAEAGACDARERLGPPQQIRQRRRRGSARSRPGP